MDQEGRVEIPSGPHLLWSPSPAVSWEGERENSLPATSTTSGDINPLGFDLPARTHDSSFLTQPCIHGRPFHVSEQFFSFSFLGGVAPRTQPLPQDCRCVQACLQPLANWCILIGQCPCCSHSPALCPSSATTPHTPQLFFIRGSRI